MDNSYYNFQLMTVQPIEKCINLTSSMLTVEDIAVIQEFKVENTIISDNKLKLLPRTVK